MDQLNKAGLIQFLKMMTEKGWINPNTGGALRGAVSKILGDVAPEQDVREIDVDMEIRRYNNLHPGDLSPDSLLTYTKRVKTSIANYVRYVEDPTKYKPPGRSPSNGTTKKSDKTERQDRNKGSDITDLTVIEAIPPAPTPKTEPVYLATETNLALPFPLRPGYLAQVVIPRDMTKAEAARLCAFIQTLASAD